MAWIGEAFKSTTNFVANVTDKVVDGTTSIFSSNEKAKLDAAKTNCKQDCRDNYATNPFLSSNGVDDARSLCMKRCGTKSRNPLRRPITRASCKKRDMKWQKSTSKRRGSCRKKHNS